jgi:histidyl-tRNA synthetase
MPEFTSTFCAGGRYDDLAGSYINKHLPGVGISIGLSRLFDVLLAKGKIEPAAKCPTDVLVVLPPETSDIPKELGSRWLAIRTADTLRRPNPIRPDGLNVELFHKPAKIGDQISYASKKVIPYVWIPPFQPGEPHKVKNLSTGEQIENVDAGSWEIPS